MIIITGGQTPPSGGATAVQVWTLVVAGVAVLATLVSAYLLRRTGKGTVEAAKQAAAASERSAQAAEKSANAAQDTVGVNRENSVGVAKRAEADAYAKRYQDAANQLGHDKASVRLAGAYAMASLADDWEGQRRTCVEVLCAYVRMQVSAEAEADDMEVRRSIIGLIGEHTRADTKLPSWSTFDIDLRDARLFETALEGCVFEGSVRLDGARFAGHTEWRDICIKGFLSFEKARVEGVLWCSDLHIDGFLSLHAVKVVGPAGVLQLDVANVGVEGHLHGSDIDVSGTLSVWVGSTDRVNNSFVQIENSRLRPTGQLNVGVPFIWRSAEPAILLNKWRTEKGGTVLLSAPESGLIYFESTSDDGGARIIRRRPTDPFVG